MAMHGGEGPPVPPATFPSARCTRTLATGIVVAGLGLGVGVWWITEMRPAVYMVLTAEVSDLKALVLPDKHGAGPEPPGRGQPAQRPLFAAGLRIRELDWSGFRHSGQNGRSGGRIKITSRDETFGLTAMLGGAVPLRAVAYRQDRLSLFLPTSELAKLRLELDPTIAGCFETSDLALPGDWLDDATTSCRRPSKTARSLLLESVGDSRLDVFVDSASDTTDILALPWMLSDVRLEEFDPVDDSARSFIRSGSLLLGVRSALDIPLTGGESVEITPATRFLLTKLAFGPMGRGLAIEVVGVAERVRLGPHPGSRRDVIPTRLEQWWHDEAFRWRIAGLGALLSAVGFLLIQVVGWYHRARQIESGGTLAVDLLPRQPVVGETAPPPSPGSGTDTVEDVPCGRN